MTRFVSPVYFYNSLSGRSLPFSKLYFFENGTQTPKPTYSDKDNTFQNPHPVIADGSGKFPDIYLDDDPYTVSFRDRNDFTQWDRDNVFGQGEVNNLFETIRNIREFGAVGDGVTDDTQAFIDAFSEPGRWIVGNFGESYLVTNPVFITKSNIKYEHRGSKIIWNGEVTQGPIGRDVGVFNVVGTLDNLIEEVVSPNVIEDGTVANYPIIDPSNYNTGDWLIFTNDELIGSPTFLTSHCVVARVHITWVRNTEDRVQISHRNGFELPIGETVRYYAITPVFDVVLELGTIIDATTTTDTTKWACGVVQKYAVNCQVNDTMGEAMRLPVLHSLWTFGCTAKDVDTNEPRATSGGQGYAIQWHFATLFRQEGSQCQGARHLFDCTNGSYYHVVDVSDQETANGSLITHGQFEHDGYYENLNVDVCSLANSDTVFGETAKRMTFKKCRMTQFFDENFVTDLTMEDCEINETSTIGNTGICRFNMDGTVLKNVVIGGALYLTKRSSLSQRSNLLDNVTAPEVFGQETQTALGDPTIPAIDITMRNCNFPSAVNCEWAGFQADNTQFEGGLNLNNVFSLTSERQTAINGGKINAGGANLHGNNMRGFKTTLNQVDMVDFGSNSITSGSVTMNGGTIINTTNPQLFDLSTDQQFKLYGVDTENVGYRCRWEDGAEGVLEVIGGSGKGTNGSGFYLDFRVPLVGTATSKIKISGVDVDEWTGTDIIAALPLGQNNPNYNISLTNNLFIGADITILDELTTNGSLTFTNNQMKSLAALIGGTGFNRINNSNRLDGKQFPDRNLAIVGAVALVKSENNNTTLVFDDPADIALTIPDGLTEDFEFFAVNKGAGGIDTVTMGTEVMRNDSPTGADGIASFTKIDATTWQRGS